MSETVRPVQMVMIDYICDTCGVGRMRPTGAYHMTSPPKYPHKCEECGAMRYFLVIYPRPDWREVDEE